MTNVSTARRRVLDLVVDHILARVGARNPARPTQRDLDAVRALLAKVPA